MGENKYWVDKQRRALRWGVREISSEKSSDGQSEMREISGGEVWMRQISVGQAERNSGWTSRRWKCRVKKSSDKQAQKYQMES